MSSKKIPATLSEDQIQFWLANSSLTREQVVDWYKAFHEYSLKNAGLDKDSFVKFFGQLKHTGKETDDLYKLVFTAFDKDGSGTIDFQEFILSMSVVGANSDMKQRLAWMFDVYDQNKDKAIDRKEIEVMIRSMLKMNKKLLVGDQSLDTKIDELFEKLDDNENGKISKDEFVNNCVDNLFMREIVMANLNA